MRAPLVFMYVGFFLIEDRGSQDLPGEPLYLTPLLEQGRVSQAQEQSRVTPDIGNMTSYSGYFTVDKACESNLFFWYFPAQRNAEQAPVVLFLQGGPGASIIYSIFEEVGPYTHNGSLGRRQFSWNVENNLVFIDQPVGTGYSFTGQGCYAENETVVTQQLYSAVVQFFQLFPELRNNRFYITGYSYAGHFIPALGYTIHNNNPSAEVKINLSGMMIGNGYMDAYYQNDMGSYLYQLGLLDDSGRDAYYEQQEKFSQYIRNNELQQALEIRTAMTGDMFNKYVGNVSILNYLLDNVLFPTTYENFIQLPSIRKAIHVGSTNYTFVNPLVETSLGVALMMSLKPEVEELLEHYFIVFYNGQLDILCAYPMMVNFLKELNWSGKEDYKNANRTKWCINEQQVGYLKKAGNLHEVLVRNAQHSVPYDQPLRGYELVNAVTSGPTNNPFHALVTCPETSE